MSGAMKGRIFSTLKSTESSSLLTGSLQALLKQPFLSDGNCVAETSHYLLAPSPSPESDKLVWNPSGATSLCLCLTTLENRNGRREGKDNGLGELCSRERQTARTVLQASSEAGLLARVGAGVGTRAFHHGWGWWLRAGNATTPAVLDHVGMVSWMATGMLGQVVAPGELLGAQRAGEALLTGVRPVVAGQLVRTRKLLVAVEPIAGERALPRVGALV